MERWNDDDVFKFARVEGHSMTFQVRINRICMLFSFLPFMKPDKKFLETIIEIRLLQDEGRHALRTEAERKKLAAHIVKMELPKMTPQQKRDLPDTIKDAIGLAAIVVMIYVGLLFGPNMLG